LEEALKHAVRVVACVLAVAPLAGVASAHEEEKIGSADGAAASPEASGKPLTVLPIHRVAPSYPESPVSRLIEGDCLLTFDVVADGTVDCDSISVECTDPFFKRASKSAIAQWRFYPPTVNGDRETVEMMFEFKVE
jgi:TonB family protein